MPRIIFPLLFVIRQCKQTSSVHKRNQFKKMNLVLTRSNQRHLNIGWEPFATSTPLKVVPSNVNIEKESQKELQICTDSLHIVGKLHKGLNSTEFADKPAHLKQLLTKRPRKNKSYVNFDFSSSSDEDNTSEKRRPVIKLSFKKQSNSLLKNKKSDEGLKTDNNHIFTCTETKKCDFKGLEQNYNHKKKNKKDTVNLAYDNLISDEENKIFDKVKDSGNLANDIKLSLEKKENKEKYFQKDENLKHLNNCDFKVYKSERVTKNKHRKHSYCSIVSQTSKSFQKLNFDKKIVRKRKCKNTEQAVNSVKETRSKRSKNKLMIPFTNESRDEAVTPFYILENKTNTSHQLFSDSREQELINILDLTSEEMNETKKSKASFLWQRENKLICSSLIFPHPSNHRKFSENQKEGRPKRNHNFKKFQLTKNISNGVFAADAEKQFKLERNNKFSEQSDEHRQKPQSLKKTEGVDMIYKGFNETNSEKNDLSYKKAERKAKKKAINKIRKKKEKFALSSAVNNINDIKLSNTDAYNVRNSLDSVESITRNQPVEEGEMMAAEKPVFKLMNELSYKEDETGCSAVECWDVNTFKCGVFKLKIKSQMTCRTLHMNSHLGGILIKGNLRMKIGSRELDLNEGDMAFVPPLTEWQATNIGKCESVFYYWCGRFKI